LQYLDSKRYSLPAPDAQRHDSAREPVAPHRVDQFGGKHRARGDDRMTVSDPRPHGPIAKSAAVIASLFSPCYLLLEKLSKSLIPHGNCPFFRNCLPVFVGICPCFGISFVDDQTSSRVIGNLVAAARVWRRKLAFSTDKGML
jgi:hypothetical protein